jgi:hypothetical protein
MEGHTRPTMSQGETLARFDAADYAPKLSTGRRVKGHQHGEANELVGHLGPGIWLIAVSPVPRTSWFLSCNRN